MQQTIAELITATESAERAIAGLKATVREADETLGERLKAAERYSIEMQQNATAGAEVLNRLSQDRRRASDGHRARAGASEPPPDAKIHRRGGAGVRRADPRARQGAFAA